MLGHEDRTKSREIRLKRRRITPQRTSISVITAGLTSNLDGFNESWHMRVWWYNLNCFLLRIRVFLVEMNCSTNRKFAGSIPGDVTGILHWHNPSGRIVALGLTQLLTAMCTRNIYWEGKGSRCLCGRFVTLFHLRGSVNQRKTTFEDGTDRVFWNVGI